MAAKAYLQGERGWLRTRGACLMFWRKGAHALGRNMVWFVRGRVLGKCFQDVDVPVGATDGLSGVMIWGNRLRCAMLSCCYGGTANLRGKRPCSIAGQ